EAHAEAAHQRAGGGAPEGVGGELGQRLLGAVLARVHQLDGGVVGLDDAQRELGGAAREVAAPQLELPAAGEGGAADLLPGDHVRSRRVGRKKKNAHPARSMLHIIGLYALSVKTMQRKRPGGAPDRSPGAARPLRTREEARRVWRASSIGRFSAYAGRRFSGGRAAAWRPWRPAAPAAAARTRGWCP